MSGLLFVWEAICFVMILLPKGDSTGVFEVQLTSLINGWGLTRDGLCCQSAHHHTTTTTLPTTTTPTLTLTHHHHHHHHHDNDDNNKQYSGGDANNDDDDFDGDGELLNDKEDDEEEVDCEEECRTFLRVCLAHLQQPLPSSSSSEALTPGCTYGYGVSVVLGGNMLDPFGTWQEETPREGQVDPNTHLSIPFTFSWPEEYTLVVEAWHDHDGDRSTQDRRHLIARAIQGGRLLPSAVWQNHSATSLHTDLAFRFRVMCDVNYYGSGCDRLCRESNDSIAGHYTCDVNGSRVCLPGWKGDSCNTAECGAECVWGGHGWCEEPHQCRCHLGWRGRQCTQCQTYPRCLHGHCTQAWECLCTQGWSGSLCDIDNFYCERYAPCQHGGSCVYDAVKNFTCACPLGYGGPQCQYPLCYPGYCLNQGQCVMREGSRVCRCRGGHQGERCQHALLTCGSLACRNNATCLRHGAHFRCLCRPGFTGTWCEGEMDECLSSPCRHGGTCVDVLNGYHCQCGPGYAGRDCDLALDPCVAFKCFNHGTCITHDSAYLPTCLCRAEFSGQRCETPLDPCVGIACLHGGTCVRTGTASFHCACAHGYSGSVCQIPPPSVLCEDQPCLNGGTCRRTQNGVMMCACVPGFRGALCESPGALTTTATTMTTTTTTTTTNSSESVNVTQHTNVSTLTPATHNVEDSGGGGDGVDDGGGRDLPRNYRVPYSSGSKTSHLNSRLWMCVMNVLLNVLNSVLFTQQWCAV